MGAVLLVSLGMTGDMYSAALVHARQTNAVTRDADSQAMVELLARLTDAARDLHGNTTTPAVPEHCLGEQYEDSDVAVVVNDVADPPRPLKSRPHLTSLPPPTA